MGQRRICRGSRKPSKVFLAGFPSARPGGSRTDRGRPSFFLNFRPGRGITSLNPWPSSAKGISEAGRSAEDIEMWQIGGFGLCHGRRRRRATRSGPLLAFPGRIRPLATKTLKRAGCLNIFAEPAYLELRRRYSTPGRGRRGHQTGGASSALFDYPLRTSWAICGTAGTMPQAGVGPPRTRAAKRLMLTVSLAVGPCPDRRGFFGEYVASENLRKLMLPGQANLAR